MKSPFLDYIFNMKEYTFPVGEKEYNAEMEKAKERNAEQMHIEDVIELIKNSGQFRLFIDSMNSIDESALYQSDVHGQKHNERVAIFAMAIGILQGLDDRDLKLVLEAAKYHDVGRVNDDEDKNHGRRSAELIQYKKLAEGLSEEDKKILQAICTGHSRNDKDIEEIMKEYGITDVDRCKKLFVILKDADALDRVRLKTDGLDTAFLRTKESRKMVLAAYEVFHNYKNIEEEVKAEEEIELPELLRYDEMQLTQEQTDLLTKQWRLIKRFAKFKPNLKSLRVDEQGRIVLPEGTLIHGSSSSKDTISSVARTGILSGEFVGIPEDSETFYCADFIRVGREQSLDEFQAWKSSSAGGRIPIGGTTQGIGYVVEPSPMLDEILKGDAYSEQAGETERSFLNFKSGVVKTFLGDSRGWASAIVGGIPSSCISGLIVSRRKEQDPEFIEFLKKTFPGRYIFDSDNIVIFDPAKDEKSEELQKKNVSLQIENAALKRKVSQMEKQGEMQRKNEERQRQQLNEMIQMLRETNAPVELLERIYFKVLHYQSLPFWLQEMKKAQTPQAKKTDEGR